MHSHTQTLPRIARPLTPRCALFRSSRPPHIVLSGLLGPQGLNSGPEPGRRETWLWLKGRSLGARPPVPGLPSPTALLGGVDYLIPAGRWERGRAARLLPVSPRHRPAAAPQYEVVLAAPGRGAAAAAAAAGGSLREPREWRGGRASPRRARAWRLFFSSREDAAVIRRPCVDSNDLTLPIACWQNLQCASI